MDGPPVNAKKSNRHANMATPPPLQVDREALDAQVRERKEARERERAEERAAAAAATHFDRSVVAAAASASQARRVQEQGVDQYRRQQEVGDDWAKVAPGRQGGSAGSPALRAH